MDAPGTAPRPPESDEPPMMTAAMASSPKPTPAMGEEMPSRAPWTTAATPADGEGRVEAHPVADRGPHRVLVVVGRAKPAAEHRAGKQPATPPRR